MLVSRVVKAAPFLTAVLQFEPELGLAWSKVQKLGLVENVRRFNGSPSKTLDTCGKWHLQVSYEDLPTNLYDVRDSVEAMHAFGLATSVEPDAADLSPSRLSAFERDASHGEEQFSPSRGAAIASKISSVDDCRPLQKQNALNNRPETAVSEPVNSPLQEQINKPRVVKLKSGIESSSAVTFSFISGTGVVDDTSNSKDSNLISKSRSSISVFQASSARKVSTSTNSASFSSSQTKVAAKSRAALPPVTEAPSSSQPSSPKGRKRGSLRIQGLQTDNAVFERELLQLISTKGRAGVMPMKPELRRWGRIDLEKAVARRGGFLAVAKNMGLQLAYVRKPKGYWENFDNVRSEVARTQKELNWDPDEMPSRKSLERAGRYDLARALEKWGGLLEVARLLGLKVSRWVPHRNTTALSKVLLEKGGGNGRNSELPAPTNRLRCEATPGPDETKRQQPMPMKAPLSKLAKKWITIRIEDLDDII